MTLSACGKTSVSTGPMRTETRSVGEFHSIEVEGATRLEITVGAPASLEIEGRELWVKRVETDVREGVLYIKSQRKDWVTIGTSPRLKIRIGVPKLASLGLEGGNDVRLSGFNGGSTKFRVAGATDLRGSGRLDELNIFMAGAGHVDMSQLVAKAADVTVAGVGSVLVHPAESLNATMNGVGTIFYSGSPREVSTHMNGLGAIGRRGGSDAKAPDVESKPVDPESLNPEYEQDPQPEAKNTGVI
ncbi:MAG TPA: head GIN domain-containing protein [Povalibacter sp.]